MKTETELKVGDTVEVVKPCVSSCNKRGKIGVIQKIRKGQKLRGFLLSHTAYFVGTQTELAKSERCWEHPSGLILANAGEVKKQKKSMINLFESGADINSRRYILSLSDENGNTQSHNIHPVVRQNKQEVNVVQKNKTQISLHKGKVTLKLLEQSSEITFPLKELEDIIKTILWFNLENIINNDNKKQKTWKQI